MFPCCRCGRPPFAGVRRTPAAAKALALALAWVALLAPEARARIGETEAECVVRYGEVIERRPDASTGSDELRSVFRTTNFLVVAEFREGRVWRIDYRKPLLDDEDIEDVLEWHRVEEPWGEPFAVFGDRFWLRSDRDVLARTLRGEGGESVVVMNRAYLDTNAAERRRQIEALNPSGPDLPAPPEGLLP